MNYAGGPVISSLTRSTRAKDDAPKKENMTFEQACKTPYSSLKHNKTWGNLARRSRRKIWKGLCRRAGYEPAPIYPDPRGKEAATQTDPWGAPTSPPVVTDSGALRNIPQTSVAGTQTPWDDYPHSGSTSAAVMNSPGEIQTGGRRHRGSKRSRGSLKRGREGTTKGRRGSRKGSRGRKKSIGDIRRGRGGARK